MNSGSTQPDLLRVVEPATEQVLIEIREFTMKDVDESIARAKGAFRTWFKVGPAKRAKILRNIGSTIEQNLEELSITEARNVGKPIRDARGEIQIVADTFNYFSGACERLCGETIPVEDGENLTFWEPLGVVGIIIPWNFPLALAAWKVAPALAAGNAVVLKPSELTPLTALRLEQLAVQSGLPEGTFNVVVGRGATVGEHLVKHPDVAKIAFTGSTAVGRRITKLAADTMKRVTLELGGKSASIVFADANIEKAAVSSPMAVFGNSGQDCCARSRILVQKSVIDKFMSYFEESIKKIRVGDPLKEETEMGSLISSEHLKKVQSYVNRESPIAFTGSIPVKPGFWFAPTVLFPVSNKDRVAQEEIFGPVAAVIPFEDESDAIAIANDTIYGLSGSIWTTNVGRALRVSRALDTGTISVNSNTSVRISTPFGGFKQSGLGRELGPGALHYYSELKNVFVSTQ